MASTYQVHLADWLFTLEKQATKMVKFLRKIDQVIDRQSLFDLMGTLGKTSPEADWWPRPPFVVVIKALFCSICMD